MGQLNSGCVILFHHFSSLYLSCALLTPLQVSSLLSECRGAWADMQLVVVRWLERSISSWTAVRECLATSTLYPERESIDGWSPWKGLAWASPAPRPGLADAPRVAGNSGAVVLFCENGHTHGFDNRCCC